MSPFLKQGFFSSKFTGVKEQSFSPAWFSQRNSAPLPSSPVSRFRYMIQCQGHKVCGLTIWCYFESLFIIHSALRHHEADQTLTVFGLPKAGICLSLHLTIFLHYLINGSVVAHHTHCHKGQCHNLIFKMSPHFNQCAVNMASDFAAKGEVSQAPKSSQWISPHFCLLYLRPTRGSRPTPFTSIITSQERGFSRIVLSFSQLCWGKAHAWSGETKSDFVFCKK